MKKISLITLSLFALAIVFVLTSLESRQWLKNTLSRSPASLSTAQMIPKSFLQSRSIGRLEREVGISFGNPLIEEYQEPVCEVFPWLEVQLQAEGVAVNGISPKINVRGFCPGALPENPQQLDFFSLLSDELCDLRPVSQDTFEVGENKVDILFDLEEFPRDWVLKSLSFHDTEPEKLNSDPKVSVKSTSQDIVISCDM